MEFEARLHQVAQRLIPAKGNTGYPPLVVVYHRGPAVELRADGTPVVPLRPAPDFVEAARWLGTRADFVVITANAPHLFLDRFESAAGRPVLSMIDATLDEVRRRGCRRLGVVGFGDPAMPVYAGPLQQMNIAVETIDASLQAKLDAAILRVHEGRESDESRTPAREAIAALRARGVNGIILGCTEIPILLPDGPGADDLINPLEFLAEAAVRFAMAP